MIKKYKLTDGRIIFAGQGLGKDKFMVFSEKANGSRKRFNPRAFPIRTTLEEAQSDLDQYIVKLKTYLKAT